MRIFRSCCQPEAELFAQQLLHLRYDFRRLAHHLFGQLFQVLRGRRIEFQFSFLAFGEHRFVRQNFFKGFPNYFHALGRRVWRKYIGPAELPAG